MRKLIVLAALVVGILIPGIARADNPPPDTCYEQITIYESRYVKFTGPNEAGPFDKEYPNTKYQGGAWVPGYVEIIEGPAPHPDGFYVYKRTETRFYVIDGDEIPCETIPETTIPETTVPATTTPPSTFPPDTPPLTPPPCEGICGPAVVVTTVAETTTTVAVETTTTVAAEQATTTEAPYVPGGTLPKTGADDPGTIAWMAAGLLGAGTLIVALARRRRTA